MTLNLSRLLVAAAVVLTCTLFLPASSDPVNVVKLVALVLCALGAVVAVAVNAVRHRELVVPTGPAAWATLALLAAVTLSAVAAPATATAVLGAYGRNSGLLAYVSALLLVLVALACVGGKPQVLIAGIVAAAGFTASYGLLQRLGVDAVPWNNPFNPIIASLGNPNFASAYMGIGVPVAAGGAMWRGWSRGWRIVSGVVAVLCLLVAMLSDAVQGPIAASAGLALIGLAVALEQQGVRRRVSLGSLIVLSGTGLAVLLSGLVAGAGPAAAFFAGNSYTSRRAYWDAAVAMFRDKPLLGVGLDHYGHFWRTHRSPESVELLGVGQFSDSAHSVPLQMLAQGGLILGLAYASFVLVTAWLLARGLRRSSGADRFLLGALGGGWFAYQVQSLVSIDQVPLIVLHLLLAAGVAAVAGVRTRVLRLPGALPLPEPAPEGRRRRVAATPRAREVTPADVVALGAVGVLGVIVAWLSLGPLRADVAVRSADMALAAGRGNDALDAYDRATDILPSAGLYWLKRGQFLAQVEQEAPAKRAFREAVEHDPVSIPALLSLAAVSEASGDLGESRRAFQAAARLDPFNADTLVAAAKFDLRHSGAQRAREQLEVAVRRLPDAAVLWASLGDARAVLGDPVAAREAYDMALRLQPGEPTAAAGLVKLQP